MSLPQPYYLELIPWIIAGIVLIGLCLLNLWTDPERRDRGGTTVIERDFQRQIVQLAKLYGWLCYHTHDSRRSAAGFPDLVLVRNGTCIVAELKAAQGRVSPEQAMWIAELDGAQISAYVWRPVDWAEIESMLGARGERR